MRRFHFNIKDGHNLYDPRGEACHSLKAAQANAVSILAEILQGRLADLIPEGRLSIEVTDDRGVLVFSVVTTVALHQPA